MIDSFISVMINNRAALKAYEEEGSTYADLRAGISDIAKPDILEPGQERGGG
jgi:hypothetical protein